MHSPIELIRDTCERAFESQFSLPTKELSSLIEITPTTQEQFGHYQCNTAMKLAKPLRLPPRQIAEKVTPPLKATQVEGIPLFSEVSVAGAGFINLTLSDPYLEKMMEEILTSPRLAIPLTHPRQRIIVDFSSPNVAKEMHVGHLRSTILGDCLARILTFLGHDVLRLNHIGDWGTSFGMLIVYMSERASKALTGEEESSLGKLMEWYKASKQLFDTDPSFKKRAQNAVVALQSGEPWARRSWEIICSISRKAYQQIYDLLGVDIEERGESFYNDMLPTIVSLLEARGLITLSEGAKCLFLEGFTNREGNLLPIIVQKSDGGYNYDTTDLAALYHRIHVEKADRVIYITDSGQATHFQAIFKAGEKAGFLDPHKVRVEHVPFGLVCGEDGKKFRTRSGHTEKLIDLLTAAVDRAEELLTEKRRELGEEKRHATARALGLGAVKYADLSCHRMSDYLFSYDRMLRFEGNTAAFLLYSYVRASSIKRKIGMEGRAWTDRIGKSGSKLISLGHPSERALALQLVRLNEVLQTVAEELLPHKLCEYLYGLAEKFNGFFRDCRVEGSEEQESRLLLCEVFAKTMRQGLQLLGLTPVEEM